MGGLRTGSLSEDSRLSKGFRILEKEIDLEKNPAGRVSIEWEDEDEAASDGRRIWKGKEGSGKGKGSCWGIVSGGLGGFLLDFEGLVLVLDFGFDFLLEIGRCGFGGNGNGGGFGCLGGVVET